MNFREAVPGDISSIQRIRNSVKENVLSDPRLVTDADCEDFISRRGKGWVCEMNDNIVGFAIADLQDNNIWALFVEPGHEKLGIGKELHRLMLDWYFSKTEEPVWLGTSPNTRAERFYRAAGWVEAGLHGKGEIKFTMSRESWELLR